MATFYQLQPGRQVSHVVVPRLGLVVRAGKTVVHVEGEIVQDDKLVARASASAIYI